MEEICIEKGVSEFGCSCISWGLYFGYFLFAISIAVIVILPLRNALKTPGDLKKSGMGIGAIIVLFLISYALSGSEVSQKAASLGVDAGGSKLIGAGLTMFYIVLIVAVIGLIYSEVKKTFT